MWLARVKDCVYQIHGVLGQAHTAANTVQVSAFEEVNVRQT